MNSPKATVLSQLAPPLRLAIGRLARRLRQESVDNLTPSQRSILASLDRHGPLRMGELASIEKISAPSISGIVGRLEGRGLVSRETDPKDARSTLVRSTPEATSILNTVRQQHSAFLASRMETLSEAEINTLKDATELLKRLAADQ